MVAKKYRNLIRSIVIALIFVFVTAPLAMAAPPAIPWGGTNTRDGVAYPDYLDEYFKDKFEKSGYDFSFLPRIRSGRHTERYGEKTWQATEDELEGFINGLSTKNLRWKNIAVFPSYGRAEGANSVSDGSFKLPFLVFSDPPVFDPADLKALDKPIVWIQGQIHGGESSGGDAMQVMAKRLAEGDLNYVLEKISVIVVPRYNVDGAWRNQRGTNSYRYRINIDQNRDNGAFESAITRKLHRMANAYEPDFFGDAHEQGYNTTSANGMPVDYNAFGVATLIAPIYNHAESLKEYVENVFEKAYHQNLTDKFGNKEEGMNGWAWYAQTTRTPPGETPGTVIGRTGTVSADVRARSGDEVILVSGDKSVPLHTYDGAIDTGITDPAFGLKGACSILTESNTPSIGQNLNMRIGGHVAVYESVVKTAYDNADEFRKVAVKARQELANRGTKVADDNKLVLTIHYPGDEEAVDHNIPVVRPAKDADGNWYAKEDVFRTKMHLSRRGTPNVAVVQPGAYIFMPSGNQANDDATIARLAHSGVVLERLNKETVIEVEAYTIDEALRTKDGTTLVPSGMTGWRDGKVITEVTSVKKEMTFPKDSYVMYMDQTRATHAAYSLEPLSLRNFGNYYQCMKTDMPNMGSTPEAEGFYRAEVGEEYPVYRYMSTEKLDTYSIGELAAGAPLTTTNSTVEWVLPYTAEEKAEIEEAIGMKALCISKNWMWLDGEDFKATMPKYAGAVNLTDAKWFAFNWAEEQYEELTADSSGEFAIGAKYINDGNIVKLVAAQTQGGDRSSGSGGGCNVAGFAFAAMLMLAGLPVVIKRKR